MTTDTTSKVDEVKGQILEKIAEKLAHNIDNSDSATIGQLAATYRQLADASS